MESTATKQLANTLEMMIKDTYLATGQDFMDDLAQSLSVRLDVPCVIISKIENQIIIPLCARLDGQAKEFKPRSLIGLPGRQLDAFGEARLRLSSTRVLAEKHL